MKLSQPELDSLTTYQSQLVDMRNQLKTFDLQVNEEQAAKGIYNELQDEFRQLHNGLSLFASLMEKRIAMGAR
jgi:hypothetical protein